MKVQDLMSKNPLTCGPDDTLHRAAQLMWEHDIGCTPIVDQSANVIGMLTDRDICMAGYTRGKSLSDCQVRDAMSTNVIHCEPGDDLSLAEARMRDAQVRRIPVLNAGHLVGILTLNDLAVAAEERRKGIGTDEVARTLGAISHHRATASAQAPAS